MATALITGASRGLGRTVAHELAHRGWNLIVDARDGAALDAAISQWSAIPEVTALTGDVGDPAHRAALAEAVRRKGRLELLLNNASTLGQSPLPAAAELSVERFATILRTNTVAPLALFQLVLPALRAASGTVVNVTSDAAQQPYPGWAGYGASKAGLEQLTAILGAEHPELAVHAFDPGDMRTAMHQDAFPGEDISDRPPPEAVVPALLRLVGEHLPSGRYQSDDLAQQRPGVLVTSGGGSR